MPVTPSAFDDQSNEMIKWLAETGIGLPIEVARFADLTIQAVATVSTPTVTLLGSNDGINYVALKATNGAAISLAGATFDMAVVLEHPFFVKPSVSGGTANVFIMGTGNR